MILMAAMAALAVACGTPKQKVYITDVQAHRGGMGLYPEESLDAMINAVNLGVNTLEMDLCVTQDGEVVLSHDKYFHHRYATRPDGTPLEPGEERVYLWHQPYEEILKWDVGSKSNPDWPEKVCQPAVKQRAAEVIDAVEAYCKEKGLAPMKYNIEIKSDPDYDGGVEGRDWPEYHEFTDLCMKMLEERNLGDRLIIQCFDERALNYINQKYPGHILAYLVEGWETNYDEFMSKLDFKPEWLSPPHVNVNQELMDRAHADGMKVVTWTVDDKDEMRRLIGLGVEAIISNYPDRLLEVVKEY
jgi:glycerophosphoryl diester phosphodiesterase